MTRARPDCVHHARSPRAPRRHLVLCFTTMSHSDHGFILIVLLAAAGCDQREPPQREDEGQCAGKCDDADGTDSEGDSGEPVPIDGLPSGDYGEMCEARRADVFNPNRSAFIASALRWSCNDVNGVAADYRGQEYCDYFAIAQLPPPAVGEATPQPVVLGKPLGKAGSAGATPASLELTPHQIDQLEGGFGPSRRAMHL